MGRAEIEEAKVDSVLVWLITDPDGTQRFIAAKKPFNSHYVLGVMPDGEDDADMRGEAQAAVDMLGGGGTKVELVRFNKGDVVETLTSRLP